MSACPPSPPAVFVHIADRSHRLALTHFQGEKVFTAKNQGISNTKKPKGFVDLGVPISGGYHDARREVFAEQKVQRFARESTTIPGQDGCLTIIDKVR